MMLSPLLLLIIFQTVDLPGRILPSAIETGRTIATNCDSIPPLNQLVLAYVTPQIKKRVGRGECWDLADHALRSIGAKWDGRYKYGLLVDPKTDCIYGGDIIQFEGVKTMHKEGSQTQVQEFAHHTAIIYEVRGSGRYLLAHQNTTFSGKKVGLSELDLSHIVRGRYKIYRPVR